MEAIAYGSFLPLLTVTDVAALLHISKNTAYALIRCGKIRSARIGQQLRVSVEDLEAYVEAQKNPA